MESPKRSQSPIKICPIVTFIWGLYLVLEVFPLYCFSALSIKPFGRVKETQSLIIMLRSMEVKPIPSDTKTLPLVVYYLWLFKVFKPNGNLFLNPIQNGFKHTFSVFWLQRMDLNHRFPGYEPSEMTGLLYTALILYYYSILFFISLPRNFDFQWRFYLPTCSELLFYFLNAEPCITCYC